MRRAASSRTAEKAEKAAGSAAASALEKGGRDANPASMRSRAAARMGSDSRSSIGGRSLSRSASGRTPGDEQVMGMGVPAIELHALALQALRFEPAGMLLRREKAEPPARGDPEETDRHGFLDAI